MKNERMTTTQPTQPRIERHPKGVTGLRVHGHGACFFFDRAKGADEPYTIGRAPGQDFRIKDTTVSRQHCEIEPLIDGRFAIVDCGAANGVHISVHGPHRGFRPVAWYILRTGIYLRLGKVVLVPIDTNGASSIIATRGSEFDRCARALYGSHSQVIRPTGRPRRRTSSSGGQPHRANLASDRSRSASSQSRP